jgi:hypothetical protein
VLFQDGSIAKSDARLPLGFLPAHPFAHELLGAFLYMQSHLFREVIEEFAAAEEIWNSSPWKAPPNWLGICPD